MKDSIIKKIATAFIESEYVEEVDFELKRDDFISRYGKTIGKIHPLKLSAKIGHEVAGRVWDSNQSA